jgi:hypothetical protein
MLIAKVSLITKKMNTLDIPISEIEYYNFINNSDITVQDAFPNLSAPLREFLITGITPSEWESVFGKEDTTEDDEDDNINFVGPADQIDYF